MKRSLNFLFIYTKKDTCAPETFVNKQRQKSVDYECIYEAILEDYEIKHLEETQVKISRLQY